VIRGIRPKKPSSSRGFTREACGAQGSWGLKIEIFFPLFQHATTTKNNKNEYFYFYFIPERPRG
jgi:hypothetical protein